MIMQHRTAQQIFEDRSKAMDARTDKIFSGLFIFEWILGIVLAFTLSPYTWEGAESSLHPHVYAAVILGGILAAFPFWQLHRYPGTHANRYIVAIAQMGFSTLFIHLTGGRIETHFHIFGSLAFIAFYRDPRPVLLATAYTTIDHLLGGFFWPERIYGVLTATPWRAVEHAAWVIFEDVFLFISMRASQEEIRQSSRQEERAEEARQALQTMVVNRTRELEDAKEKLLEQQQIMVNTAKMSALGEMAGGVAHEINNPLAIITFSCANLERLIKKDNLDKEVLLDTVSSIDKTVHRIAKIVKGLRTFSRHGQEDFADTSIVGIIQDTLVLCTERFKNHDIELKFIEPRHDTILKCNGVALSQVLLNLLGNAADAVQECEEKWVRIEIEERSSQVIISVTDSGRGIAPEVAQKIMQPFFTTKEVGKGTGLGLSISKGIMSNHKGALVYNDQHPHTRFEMVIPLERAG